MSFTREQRKKIISRFLNHCEKIGYTDPNNPPKVEIVDGLPMALYKPTQSIRFDKNLTNGRFNTTMD